MKKYLATSILIISMIATSAQARPFNGFHSNNGLRMGLMQEGTGIADNGRILPLRDVLQMINSQYPGSALSASPPVDMNGRKVYIIRWQTDRGVIIDFQIDAESGQILRKVGG